MPKFAVIGLTIGVILLIAILVSLFQNYIFGGSVYFPQPVAGVHVFLFAYNPALDNYPLAEYSVPLYEKIGQITGIQRPTFEQIHYTITKEHVFNYTNRPIESYEFVKIIVSDSIVKPTDGLPLTEDDISPAARFRYSSLVPASLLFENDGSVQVWDSEHYDNPNNLPSEKTLQVIVLPVQAADFAKVNEHYDEIKPLVETFEPPAVLQKMKVYIFPRYAGTDVAPNDLADRIRTELGLPFAADYGFSAGASRAGIYLLDGSITLPSRVEFYIDPSVKLNNGDALTVANIDNDFQFGSDLKVSRIALNSPSIEDQWIYAVWIVVGKPDIEKADKNVDEIHRLIQMQILRNTRIEPTT